MQIVWTILSSIFILYIWIWVIESVFGSEALKTKVVWKVLIIGGILVGGLFAYKYLLTQFGFQHLSFSQTTNWQTLLLFTGYCTAILFGILLIFRKRTKQILQTLFIGSLFFLVVNYGGLFLGINTLILYYIVSAYAEEYLKYVSSTSLITTGEQQTSNLIFFCVLLGLGFSLVENILYLISVILSHQHINLIGFLVGRGLISALLHVVATGTIGFIQYRLQTKSGWVLATFIGMVAGLALHSGYNLGLEKHLTYITIPLVVFMFFLLSYLLFQSDMLYKKNETLSQK